MLALAALTLSLQLRQTSFDLLDGVSIEVATHNSATAPVVVKFAQPPEYEIDVLRGSDVIWKNSTEVPVEATFPVHTRQFVPGPSVLVVYIWNGTESDGAGPRDVHRARTASWSRRDARSEHKGALHRSHSGYGSRQAQAR